MLTLAAVGAVREWRNDRRAVGLVPTMGFLHEGHLSLVRRARDENDAVVASIFVNPTQFGPDEDLAAYPRDRDRDLDKLAGAGCDLVFVPEAETMYPPGFQTWVEVGEVSRPLEGARRGGHFRGVATVVAKLLHIVQPNRAYFGQKDAQQLAVIRAMVRDLDFPLEVVGCPTVREPDGLAMSSRNVYLNPEERRAAAVLYRSLTAAARAYQDGEHGADVLRARMRSVLCEEPLAEPEYVSVADPLTLAELDRAVPGALLSMAVRLGPARLIDNLVLEG